MSRLPLQLHPCCVVVDLDLLELALDGAEGETQILPTCGGHGIPGILLPASQKGWRRGGGVVFLSVVNNHICIGNKFS